MTVHMRLEDIGRAHGGDAVGEHGRAVAIDQRQRQAEIVIFARLNAVDAVIGEQRRQFLQPVVVDDMRIVRAQRLDARAQGKIGVEIEAHGQIPMHSRHPFQNPRTAASVTREP